jgi:hypothetical protein
MRNLVLLVALAATCTSAQCQTLQQLQAKRIHLPNGWALTPVGTSLQLGDLPLNIAVSSTQKYLAVTNNGQSTQSLQLLSLIHI